MNSVVTSAIVSGGWVKLSKLMSLEKCRPLTFQRLITAVHKDGPQLLIVIIIIIRYYY